MELAKSCTVSPIKANSPTLWNPTCSLLSSGNSNSYHCQQPLNKTVLWLLCFFVHLIDLTRKMGNICGQLPPSTFSEAKDMNTSLPPGSWRTPNPGSPFLCRVPWPWNHFNQFLRLFFSRSRQLLKQLAGLCNLWPVCLSNSSSSITARITTLCCFCQLFYLITINLLVCTKE